MPARWWLSLVVNAFALEWQIVGTNRTVNYDVTDLGQYAVHFGLPNCD